MSETSGLGKGLCTGLSAGLSTGQKQRLEHLRADLEELRSGADPSVPAPAIDEPLLVRLVRADSAYATLPRKFLAGCGFEVKAPDEIDDADLRAELWRLIWIMALLRLLLERTDHLDDRRLYERLYEEELMEPTNFQPGEPDAPIYVTDLLGGHSQHEIRLLLTFYADRLDDDLLAELRAGLEGEPPEPRQRPGDRDRFLP